MIGYLGKEGETCDSLNDSYWYTRLMIRLTAKTEKVGHKVYMTNSSPELLDYLCTKTITAVGLLDQTESDA
jgi:hypothetical protein